ncbi:MAG: PKD domain-containing protein [Bacteroidetes bacterium]|nr:PKD domain-containing protein [Bacteroidota bacterium]
MKRVLLSIFLSGIFSLSLMALPFSGQHYTVTGQSGSDPDTLSCVNFFSYTNINLVYTFSSFVAGGTPPYIYTWTFGDGGTSGLPNPVHTYAGPGSYMVTLTTVASNGCTYTSTDVVTVGGTPCTANFMTVPDSSNQTMIYFIDQSTGIPVTWAWTFGDGGTANIPYPVHTYAQAGTYWVCLTITTASGCFDTYCDSVLVGGISNPMTNSFTWAAQQLTVTFTGTVTGGTPPYVYAWDFGDGNVAGVQNPVHTYTIQGSYTVIFTVLDYTSNYSYAQHTVTVVSTGIPEPAVQPTLNTFTLYPNPASDKVTIEYSLKKGVNATAIISDLPGNQLFKVDLNGEISKNKLDINTSSLKPGTYIVTLWLSDGKKLMKKLTLLK